MFPRPQNSREDGFGGKRWVRGAAGGGGRSSGVVPARGCAPPGDRSAVPAAHSVGRLEQHGEPRESLEGFYSASFLVFGLNPPHRRSWHLHGHRPIPCIPPHPSLSLLPNLGVSLT